MSPEPRLPDPRGPLTRELFACLRLAPHSVSPADITAPPASPDPLADDDLQLALYACYELHYRGFDGVDPDWEWDPSLLALRAGLEARFEAGLREAIGGPEPTDVDPGRMDLALRDIADRDDGPSLARYVETQADARQVREALILRSAYQLKEADPHSWAIPRLFGPPKAALVEIQADEYGGGRPERMHAQMYAAALAAAQLDPAYGAYLDRIPGATLATVNLMSWVGLHRRWRGALVGNLAMTEMVSSLPNGQWANGLRRLGYGPAVTAFFDEHVLADAVHENIAGVDMAGGLARQQPDLTGDILWGARALLHLDGRAAGRALDAWRAGRSSLLAPAAVSAV
jgi:hypothetical protein